MKSLLHSLRSREQKIGVGILCLKGGSGMREPIRSGRARARNWLVLLALTCGLLSEAIGQGLDTTDYFPLNRGDMYSYSNVDACPPATVQRRYYPFMDSRTTDTIRIDGKKYFVKDRFFVSPDTIRVDENADVFIRRAGKDETFYKLRAAVGDTWTFRYSSDTDFRVTLISRTDSIKVPAGTFHPCLKFELRFNVKRIVDWLAPNVGLVYRCIDETIELHDAEIKGVKYPIITSVRETGLEPIIHLILFQNYPNPINPQTTIRYELKSAGHITVRISDVRGSEVRTLFNGFAQEGRHELSWDGRDHEGGTVSSGVYFCILTMEGYHLSIKILVIR